MEHNSVAPQEHESPVQKKSNNDSGGGGGATPPPFQLKAGNNPPPSNPSGGGGNSGGLPNEVQGKMEGALGADFSNVNIHANSSKASDVGALAYTQGNDVHFAPGQFKPDTKSGQELIGHELQHVVQQRENRVKPTTQVGSMPVNDDKGLEKEADVMGAKAAAGGPAQAKKSGSGSGGGAMQAKMASGPIQMQASIRGSVGKGGRNRSTDVKTVQRLLNQHGKSLKVDGIAGPLTIGAIESFQQQNFGWKDGRVDVGGKTWGKLIASPSSGGGGGGSTNTTYTVRRGDTLGKIAKAHGVSVNEIMAANPSIKNPNRIYVGQKITIPTKNNGGGNPPPSGGGDPEPNVYTVKRGDTLGKIARSFNTTVAAILSANPSITNPNLISIGQKITIPSGTTTTPTPTGPTGPETGGGEGGENSGGENESVSIIHASKVSVEFARKVIQISRRLSINPNYLMAAMHFESAGTFRPDIRNAAGSGATGLIQFMPATARGLGTSTTALAQMTAVEQLDYVEMYFQPYAGRLSSLEDIYMAILWPRAIGEPNNYVLWSRGTRAYTMNAGLDTNRDGSVTKAEAAGKVRGSYDAGLDDTAVIHTNPENQGPTNGGGEGGGPTTTGPTTGGSPEVEPPNRDHLEASVGARGGVNNAADVALVQHKFKGLGADIKVTGEYNDQTRAHIFAYQRIRVGRVGDGRIDPGGGTWRAVLNGNPRFDTHPWEGPSEEKLSNHDRPIEAPGQRVLKEIYGDPGQGRLDHKMVNVPVPFTMKWYTGSTVSNIKIHENVAGQLASALSSIKSHYGQAELDRLRITHSYAGSHVHRTKRGGSEWSTHAYGIAMDFNSAENGLNLGANRALFAGPEYRAFLDIMEQNGFYNLGRYKNYDYMHFQAAVPG